MTTKLQDYGLPAILTDKDFERIKESDLRLFNAKERKSIAAQIKDRIAEAKRNQP